LYGWGLPHGGFDFLLLKPVCRQAGPFGFAFKERFLFDWERKYTSPFRNSNTPVNFFSKNLHLPSQNNPKIICTGQFYTRKQPLLFRQLPLSEL
jgi:hypothetical protein